jgi:hypothetical protein
MAVSINEFLADKRIHMVPEPPTRRNSVPVISFYSKAQKALERVPFWYLDKVQENITDELEGIRAEDFQHCCEHWKQRHRRCEAVQGNYF